MYFDNSIHILYKVTHRITKNLKVYFGKFYLPLNQTAVSVKKKIFPHINKKIWKDETNFTNIQKSVVYKY